MPIVTRLVSDVLPALAGMALIAAAVPASAYEIGRCEADAEAAFDKLGIDRTKISEVKTDTILSGGETLQVTSHNLWLHSTACDGSYVLVFTSSCGFLDTFTRGSCTPADFQR